MNGVHARFHPSARDRAGRAEYWASLALRHCEALGPVRTKLLLEHFGSAQAAVEGVGEWRELELPARAISCMRGERWREKARMEWDAVRENPCGLLLRADPEYPELLAAIPDPPLFLYFYGDIALLSNLCVGVVGARNCSVEGLRTTVQIGRGLAAAGITIVSGMARGIDRAAHLAGLERVGGSIAVLGCGLDVPYPKSNLDLRELLFERGLVLTEYGPGVNGIGRHFIVRNRIISGISRAVLVTEAALRSGSLNTARHALEQGREVMAVPGATGARHLEGCKELVRNGAKPVFAAEDVLCELLPQLEETVRKQVQERDLARFRPRGEAATAGKTDGAGEIPDPFSLELAPGLLPWEADDVREDENDSAVPCAKKDRRGAPVRRSASSLSSAAASIGASTAAPTRANDTRPVEPAGNCMPPDPLPAGVAGELLIFLHAGQRHIDDICRALGQNADIVSRLLLQLELDGHVRRLPGMVYCLSGTAATV